MAATLGGWILMLAGSWHSSTLRPGMLAQPHAQILGSRLASNRCATCHPAAQNSLVDWFFSAASGHRGVTQSQLCMDCHHTTLAKERALLAHNLTAAELHLVAAGRAPSSWRDSLPGPAVNQQHVPCAACHREHHGTDAELTQITNAQCQTCHRDRFQSFATDHPDWQDWPYGRRETIAFDHVTHYGKHFGEETEGENLAFFQDCRTCHASTAAGEVARLASFEAGCAACHEKSLQLEASEGVTLLAIPSLPLPPEEMSASWPESARGFYDGRIGPLTRLLIGDRAKVSEALSHLPATGELAKIDPHDSAQTAAASEVALAIARLLEALAERGNPAVVDRLRDQGVPETTAREIGRWLSPQLVRDAHQRWFREAPGNEEAARNQTADLLQADRQSSDSDHALLRIGDVPEELPTSDDSLLIDEAAERSTQENDPLLLPETAARSPAAEERQAWDVESAMPWGGWFRDDRRLAIRYRGTRHADPVLRTVIDLAVALPADDLVRRELLSLGATASCIRCHQIDSQTAAVHWKGQRTNQALRRFTKFSHQPHLPLKVLENCRHCHQVRPLRNQRLHVRLGAGGERSLGDRHDFEPLPRQTCVACHTAGAAGDRCTKCHLYHPAPMATLSDPG